MGQDIQPTPTIKSLGTRWKVKGKEKGKKRLVYNMFIVNKGI